MTNDKIEEELEMINGRLLALEHSVAIGLIAMAEGNREVSNALLKNFRDTIEFFSDKEAPVGRYPTRQRVLCDSLTNFEHHLLKVHESSSKEK